MHIGPGASRLLWRNRRRWSACSREPYRKVLIRGLPADVTEQMLRDKLSPHAPVKSVEMVRDGDPNQPWAWVDLDVDLIGALGLVRRFDLQYLGNSMMRWHIPAHQE